MTQSLKEKILEKFIHQTKPLSGTQLAQEFQVSRNAIWKTIQNLNQSGYQIQAKKGSGYLLESLKREIDPLQISIHTKDSFLKPVIFHKEIVSSTNDWAKEYSFKANFQNALFIADQQTEGRGRYGNSFYSQLENGLYFSLLLKADPFIHQKLDYLTMIAALTLTKTLNPYLDTRLKIKWVNDLFYQGKKVAGILTEANFNLESQELTSVIVGIGLNLSGSFPPQNEGALSFAGTLFKKSLPKDFSKNQFLSQFLHQFCYELTRETKLILKDYEALLMGKGCIINFQQGSTHYQGTLLGIDEKGHLKVRLINNQIITLSSGQVHLGSQQFYQLDN